VPHTPGQVCYSPITPATRKREVRIYSDPDAEIQETDKDVKAGRSEEMVGEETPIRKIIRKPLSESISNVKGGTARIAANAGTKGSGLESVRSSGLLDKR
jgi:hypothetical protein